MSDAPSLGSRIEIPTDMRDRSDFSVAGFERTMGLEFQEIGPDEVVATLRVGGRLIDHSGHVHGGVLAGAAEAVASIGTWAGVNDDGSVPLGQNISSRVLADVKEGARLEFSARLLSAAPDVWTWLVETQDDQDRLCATATVSVAVRQAKA